MVFPDVVLFAKYNFHKSCLAPIHRELQEQGINVLYSSKRHEVYDLYNEYKKKFKVFVIADEWFNLFRDCSKIMCTTNHSMASKNTTFSPKHKEGDFIYASSSWQKIEFIRRGVIPIKDIIPTGYPAADILLSSKPSYSHPRKNLLFAPTYNRYLNLVDYLIKAEKENSLFEELENYNIRFKLHPVLPKKYPYQNEFCLNLMDKYSYVNMIIDSHADITDSILWSDIVIGDCSGAMLLALAADRPVIAYNNPERVRSSYYDKDGPEWDFRSYFAYEFNDASDPHGLPDAINDINVKDYKKDTRKQIKDLLYGDFQDGKSYKRIAEHIISLLR